MLMAWQKSNGLVELYCAYLVGGDFTLPLADASQHGNKVISVTSDTRAALCGDYFPVLIAFFELMGQEFNHIRANNQIINLSGHY